MRHLFLLSSLAGGPSRIVADIISQKKKGHYFIVVSLSNIKDEDIYRKIIKNVDKLVVFQKNKKLNLFGFIKQFLKIRQLKADKIYSVSFATHVLAYCSVLLTNVIWYPAVHSSISAFTPIRRIVEAVTFRRAKIIITPSIYIQKKIIDHRISKEEKIYAIPNGVEFYDTYQHKSLPTNIINLCYIANFYSRIKGHRFLVEALDRLPTRYRLTFIGTGVLESDIKRQVSNLNLDQRVKFLGFQNHAVIKQIMNEINLFVMPSLNESFGLAAAEAMANGIPVVGSDVGGLSEIINNGVNGYLTKPGDSVELAVFIEKVFESEEVYSMFQENAFKTVENNLSVKTMVERYYEHIIDA